MADDNFGINTQPRGAVMGPFSKQPAAYAGADGGPIGIFDKDGLPTETLAALTPALTAMTQADGAITNAADLTADAQVVMASIYDELPPLIVKRSGKDATRAVKYTSLPLEVTIVGKDKVAKAWVQREEPSVVNAGTKEARANLEKANDALILLKRVKITLQADAAGGALTYGSSL